jgi:hypothetical protein
LLAPVKNFLAVSFTTEKLSTTIKSSFTGVNNTVEEFLTGVASFVVVNDTSEALK